MKMIKVDDIDIHIIDEMKAGRIFVYPTDTIYGIGCNALDETAVGRIFEIKRRLRDKPVSVIAPSVKWIEDNCICNINMVKKYLPGPYTLILQLKDKGFLLGASAGTGKIGVRIIGHRFMRIIEKAGVPFVTTSVNISGEAHVHEISDIDDEIRRHVDYAIDDGRISGKPSIIIDMSGRKEKIISR